MSSETHVSDAFRALFQAHAGELQRYARRIVRSRDLAEDVVQDVFLRLWVSRERLELGPGTRSYLYLTTRARSIDCLARARRDASRARCGDDWLDSGDARTEAPQDPDADESPDAELIGRAFEAVLASMPPRRREVAVLRWRSRCSTAEIATRLVMSPRTVEGHVADATRLLRARLPALLLRAK